MRGQSATRPDDKREGGLGEYIVEKKPLEIGCDEW